MKNSKFSYIIPVIALIVGVVIYALFATGVLTTELAAPYFLTTASIGAVSLSALVIAGLSERSRGKTESVFCNCGLIALTGAVGTTIISLITAALSAATGIAAFVLAAVLFFFITLLLGGIACMIYSYNNCGRDCCCTCEHDCRNNF